MLRVLVLSTIVGAVIGSYGVDDDWWQNALFYQVYVRSFRDSDGDGVGDIRGVTIKIPYLEELGINAIILSPIFKSPQNDYGYDVQDFYSLNPEYGNAEEFDRLVKVGNEHGIKILLDFVPNHSSNESEWFIKSAHKDEYYSDWYIWEEGHMDGRSYRSPPNNWLSVFQGSAWEYSPIRDQFYLHQFGKTQPDLNLRNPVVVDEIKNIIKFWLEKGVAGMRLSSVNHLIESDKDMFGGQYPNEPLTGKSGVAPEQYDYLQHIYTANHEENFEIISQIRDVFDSIALRDNLTRVLITEARTDVKGVIRFYGRGMHYGSHIPVNFLFIDELSKDSDARDLKFAIDHWMTYKPLKKPANWMIGNHDVSRVASRFGPGLVDAFNMLILLLPGVGITYMGEEIGMTNGFISWSDTRDPLACRTDDPVNYVEVSRDPFRTPFQWSTGKNAGFSTADRTWIPVNDGFERKNCVTQKASVRSHYQVYKSLASLRTRPAFKYGRYDSMVLNNDVFAFKRWHNEEAYIIVMNIGKYYHVVNLTAFDLIFGQLEVEVSSIISPRTYSDIVQATSLDLVAEEALVLRMQV